MSTPDHCKDCEKIENVKETLKVHAEKIETNRNDIANIKAEEKETKLYVKMILEKIEYLTLGFENSAWTKKKSERKKSANLNQQEKRLIRLLLRA